MFFEAGEWHYANVLCEKNNYSLWNGLSPSAVLQKEELQIYEKYCQNKPRSEALWRQCGDSMFFQVRLI